MVAFADPATSGLWFKMVAVPFPKTKPKLPTYNTIDANTDHNCGSGINTEMASVMPEISCNNNP